jgi:hypothetical protein
LLARSVFRRMIHPILIMIGIRCQCFQEDESPNPDYDWDQVPSVDPEYIYCHPILQGEVTAMKATAATASATIATTPEEEQSNGGKHNSDSKAEEVELEVAGTKKKKKKKKKKKVKVVIPLKCSYQQFVELLQELLTFHAFYWYGNPPFDHSPSQDEIDNLQLLIQKMVACITTFCLRNTGYGCELQKLHDQNHIVLDLLYFHHCLVWDAGTGE